MLINGAWVEAERTYDVIDPYRHEPVWRAPNSTAAELEKAISAAVAAKSTIANMPGYERAALLRRVGVLLRERVDVIAEAMAPETGKAIRDARAVRTGGISSTVSRPGAPISFPMAGSRTVASAAKVRITPSAK
ncbi:MAG: uncharacterized protein JWN71_4005 [Xanthobacteraceae bacterium]|nr:uncharacterized protein [Xanthobacteraceae bacterium]